MDQYQKKILIRKYENVELPVTGQLIIQRKGPWMGIGFVIGIRFDMFQVEWVLKGKKPVILPYELDEVKIKLGSGTWALHDGNKNE